MTYVVLVMCIYINQTSWDGVCNTSRRGPGVPIQTGFRALRSTFEAYLCFWGHKNSGKNSKAIFELTQSMQWTRLEQTLKIGHFGRTLAIPIPDDLVSKHE